MPSSTLSDPLLQVAFWTGAVSLAIALAMALLIVGMRRRLRRRARAWARFVHTWRPVLMRVILGDDGETALPGLRPGEREDLLRLWIYLHESVRGDAHERLRRAARALGLDTMVRERLHARSRSARLQAVLAAGLLRDADTWDTLAGLARGGDSPLAAIAARALVRIDAPRACPLLLPLVLQRRDWNPAQAAAIVDQGGPAWHGALAAALEDLPADYLPRVLTWVAAMRPPLPDALVRRWLLPDRPATVLRAALRLARAATLADAVALLARHSDPGVRELASDRLAALSAPEAPAGATLVQAQGEGVLA